MSLAEFLVIRLLLVTRGLGAKITLNPGKLALERLSLLFQSSALGGAVSGFGLLLQQFPDTKVCLFHIPGHPIVFQDPLLIRCRLSGNPLAQRLGLLHRRIHSLPHFLVACNHRPDLRDFGFGQFECSHLRSQFTALFSTVAFFSKDLLVQLGNFRLGLGPIPILGSRLLRPGQVMLQLLGLCIEFAAAPAEGGCFPGPLAERTSVGSARSMAMEAGDFLQFRFAGLAGLQRFGGWTGHLFEPAELLLKPIEGLLKALLLLAGSLELQDLIQGQPVPIAAVPEVRNGLLVLSDDPIQRPQFLAKLLQGRVRRGNFTPPFEHGLERVTGLLELLAVVDAVFRKRGEFLFNPLQFVMGLLCFLISGCEMALSQYTADVPNPVL